VKYKNMMW